MQYRDFIPVLKVLGAHPLPDGFREAVGPQYQEFSNMVEFIERTSSASSWIERNPAAGVSDPVVKKAVAWAEASVDFFHNTRPQMTIGNQAIYFACRDFLQVAKSVLTAR